MKKMTAALLALLCLGALPLTSCGPVPWRAVVAAVQTKVSALAGPTSTPTPYPCPQATAEYFYVDPVLSPTDELAQVVVVHMGNMEMATITTESGVFTAADGQVEVQLLPNTAHHLEVEARVRQMTSFDGCVYGGYSLHTTTDYSGAPLIIVQGKPAPPRIPEATIDVGNAGRLVELASFGPQVQSVTDFSFLGNDTLLSVGYADDVGRINGWSLVTGEKVLEIEGSAAEALAVVASPDGALIATGGTGGDAAVRLWVVLTSAMQELGRHNYHLESVAFSPSGALLASGDNGDVVRVWSVEDGRLVATFTGDVPGRLQSFTDLYWPDDQTLMAGGAYAVYAWDVTTTQLVRRVPAPEGVQFLVGTAFAPGGQRIAAAAQDNRLYLWNGQWTAWEVPEAGAVLASVAFSPDARLVVAETHTGAFYVWDVASGALLATRQPPGPQDGVSVRFSPDGRYLATGGWGAPIRVWGVP